MDNGNRDQARLAKCDQRFCHHVGCDLRFVRIGRFFQIQAGAESGSSAAQNEHAFVRFIRGDFDGRGQFVQQLNRKRVAPLGTVERHNGDLGSLPFD